MAEWIRASNSSSGASVQQSMGSNPDCDTCVLLKQDTQTITASLHPVFRGNNVGSALRRSQIFIYATV